MPKLTSSNSFSSFLHRVLLNEKLNNWTGFFIVACIAVIFGYLLANNIIIGLGVFGMIVGISILIVCLVSAEYGLYINLVYSFSASALSRFLFKDQMPVGIVTDILVFTTFLGLFFSNENLKKNTNAFFKNRPVIYYLIILIYLSLELLNPIGHSFEGWLQVMRKVFESFIIVFIAYNVFDNLIKIQRFIRILFFFVLLAAIYGCFQQWHGLLSAEINWVHSDPERLGLIYIFGEYRKFSIFGGPTEFGIIMATCSLFYVLISLNKKNQLTKYLYIIGSIFMLLGMAYSGTRTANAMLVGGVGIFILLTINKRSTKIFAFFAVMSFLFLMYVPIYSNLTLIRFRSSFSGTKDASYKVREINRQSVQPYIYAHPIGAGLSTTGDMGKKYNPGSPLAGFPTDSSYLNKALESGWIGLILTCLLYFAILQHIIRSYFLTKNKEFKTLLAASLAFFFSYFIGEITQEAVGVFTNMFIYFPLFAIIVKLRKISEENFLKA